MENTIENKKLFFGQYYGQTIIFRQGFIIRPVYGIEQIDEYDSLLLTPLSKITDKDAIEVAKLSHQFIKGDFKIIPDNKYKQSVSLEYVTANNIVYRTVINFSCAGVSTFVRFEPHGEDTEVLSYVTSIGKVNFSSQRPIQYIIIVDYLRSKGYALPFMGLSVEKLIEYGWIIC